MMKANFSVPIEMRDGIKLSTIVYTPKESGSFPTVLIRTPYSAKNFLAAVDALKLIGGFVIVLQDTRGRYDSEGQFIPFKEKNDTLDTISWIKQQSWSNSRIIVVGPSYLGYVALQVLDEEGDSIDAIFAPMTFSRPYDGLVYRNGVMNLHWALPWSIMTSTHVQAPLTRVNGTWPENYTGAHQDKVSNLGWPGHVWEQFLEPKDTKDWMKYSINISKPLKARVCLIGGWYDFLLGATFKAFEDLTNVGGHPPDLILGPWGHNGYMQSLPGVGDFEFGTDGQGNAVTDFNEMMKRAREGAGQHIRAFILRSNEWKILESWPPSCDIAEVLTLYIDCGNTLNEDPPREDLEFGIPSDPSNPVPTIGGAVWEFPPFLEPGPADQSPLQERNDVLRFFGKPATHDYTILGSLSADIWVKHDSPMTHFTSKLLLEDQEGKQRILQDGIVSVEGPLSDYKQVQVDLLAIGIQIERTERIGLEISWSNFPKYELPQLDRPTLQTVKSSPKQPSFVRISILK